MRVLNYRIAVTGPPAAVRHGCLRAARRPRPRTAGAATRRVRVDGGDLEAPVWERLDLPEGAEIPGPAILEQPDTTIFVDPGLTGRVDRFGNLIITRADDGTL